MTVHKDVEAIYCPLCGCNADQHGIREVENCKVRYDVLLLQCENCNGIVQDGQWLSYWEAREEFA